MAERAGFNIKCRVELRRRAQACADLEGLALPEYVRAAVVAHCERTERLHARWQRAANAAAGQAERQ